MPRRHREYFTSDSELADSNDDPFELQSDADFDCPTSVSGSDNNEPSPSQYREETAMQSAYQSNDEKTEREEDEAISEMFDGEAYDRMVVSID